MTVRRYEYEDEVWIRMARKAGSRIWRKLVVKHDGRRKRSKVGAPGRWLDVADIQLRRRPWEGNRDGVWRGRTAEARRVLEGLMRAGAIPKTGVGGKRWTIPIETTRSVYRSIRGRPRLGE